jgi:hypothetical protein
MSFNASPQQALAMFSIVFANSENERRPQMGDWLRPNERAPLEKARLIELEQDRRAKRVILTDAGWAWAAANLNAQLPRNNWAARVLQDVLTRLGPHLDSNDAALAQFAMMPSENDQIGLRPIASKKPETRNSKKPVATTTAARRAKTKATATRKAGKKTRAPKKSATNKADKKIVATEEKSRTKKPAKKNEAKKNPDAKIHVTQRRTVPQVAKQPPNLHKTPWERIRSAALELAGGQPRTRVRLRDLRARLNDMPRAQLDRELMELQRAGSLVLYRIDDPTDVTKDDELAALQVAGFPRHILYLES